MSTIREEVKEINKPVNKRLLRPYYDHVRANSVGSKVQCDLMDLSAYRSKKGNRNYAYILLFMDVYSRYGWAYPVKYKTAEDCNIRLGEWLRDISFTVEKVYSDNGGEFLGAFNRTLEKMDIDHIIKDSKEQHQVVVERWIRTLKEKIKNKWIENNNFDWVGILDEIVMEYNSSKHSRMREKPIDVLNGVVKPNWVKDKPKKDDLEIGDSVRIIQIKSVFDKPSLTLNYSKNVYKVESIDGTRYKLNNGKEYPRWKLLKSKFEPMEEIKEKNVEIKEIKNKKMVKQYLKREDLDKKNILPGRTRGERRYDLRKA